MRTVDSYRGLQVYVLDAGEEVPSWVQTDVAQGRAVMAVGEFTSTAGLAQILDRYIDEVLRSETEPPGRPAQPPSGPRQRGTR